MPTFANENSFTNKKESIMTLSVDNENQVSQRMLSISYFAAKYDGIENYREAVHQLAWLVNRLFRLHMSPVLISEIHEMTALCWYYAKKEFRGTKHRRDLDNYEAFIESLRTDVYMELYRWVNNYYGFVEPKTMRK